MHEKRIDRYIKTKSGRLVYVPTDEEDAKIRAGIAADPDTRELTKEEIQQMRPVGCPKTETTKSFLVTHPAKQFSNL